MALGVGLAQLRPVPVASSRMKVELELSGPLAETVCGAPFWFALAPARVTARICGFHPDGALTRWSGPNQ